MVIAKTVLGKFAFDRFTFIPAFHAPHKPDRKPTSAFHRNAMLVLATSEDASIEVSSMELELPSRPYTVETLAELQRQFPDDEIYFVMGADSWQDIQTWREWEKVLMMTNHIVVSRPGYTIAIDHIPETIHSRIHDCRGMSTICARSQVLPNFLLSPAARTSGRCRPSPTRSPSG
ncbi:MAG: hypothetical protein LC734_10345 [Acidobacteria bacterium]|nr:hypothetical protein [Acidobacteriota bacterium]